MCYKEKVVGGGVVREGPGDLIKDCVHGGLQFVAGLVVCAIYGGAKVQSLSAKPSATAVVVMCH
jgi:hypothetical protein